MVNLKSKVSPNVPTSRQVLYLFSFISIWTLFTIYGKNIVLSSFHGKSQLTTFTSNLVKSTRKIRAFRSNLNDSSDSLNVQSYSSIHNGNNGDKSSTLHLQQLLHQIEYGSILQGIRRTPVVMIRGNLHYDVLQLLSQDPIFVSEEKFLTNLHMSKAVDYVRAKDTHFYYEGYFHSRLNPDPILSRNPRSGQEFKKPPAGDILRAFYESFRRVNQQTFDLLRQHLILNAKLRSPEKPQLDICGLLAQWISEGRVARDLSIQLHYGSHIHGPQLFWHTDAESSLVHLGLTIGGYRILHSKRAATPTGEVKELLENQTAGTVYLSSSTLMNHAPEYPSCAWNNRIIAIQARMMYNTTELKYFRSLRTDKSWEALTDVLSSVLARMELKLPTINEISIILDEMKEKSLLLRSSRENWFKP